MQKKTRYSIFSLTPLLLIIAAFACNKPAHIGNSYINEISPVVFSTSLADTLPLKTVEQLQAKTATGIKVQYIDGRHVCYFEYEADPRNVIKAISNVAFSKIAVLADTTCRRVSQRHLELLKQQISASEMDHSAFFWSQENDNMHVYECIKPPFKHTLLVGQNSIRIFHRIEFLG